MAGLGQVLREAREQRGITLAEAEKATKVRKTYLAALEAEDYSPLPPTVFVRGYLRSYALYLGIDPDMVLLLYPYRVPANGGSLPRRRKRGVAAFPGSARGFVYALGSLAAAALVGLLLVRWLQPTEPTPTMGLVLDVATKVPPAAATTVAATPSLLTVTPFALSATVLPQPTAVPTASTPQPTVAGMGGAIPAEWVRAPSVTGTARAAAEDALSKAGLKATVVEEWNRQVAVGLVVSQDPAAGSEVARGSDVTLVVSRGAEMATVPRLYGLKEADAVRQIREAGLTPSRWVAYQGHDTLPDSILSRVCVGCVLSSLPAPGSVVPANAEIFYAVRAD